MNVTWMITRGSGFVAFAMLAASALLGLLVSSKLLERRISPKTLTFMHESASLAALLATATHVIALSLDEYVDFGVRALLIPGAASWKPQAVAFGIVAMWGSLIAAGSFYIRTHIGRTAWRVLHYTSFGVFVAALVHGLMAGTDSGNPVALALYVSSAAAVVVLTAARIVLFRTPAARRAPAARSSSAARTRPAEPARASGEISVEVSPSV